ncbi:predicted hydrolase, N-terminal part [Escherichia albertii]|nr:predicted hydrolase, N-terminal part [Escherichia albertii]
MTTTQQSGFAPAASPLASTIVQTPDDAIVVGFTSIPSQGDNMPARQTKAKRWPAACGHCSARNFWRA